MEDSKDNVSQSYVRTYVATLQRVTSLAPRVRLTRDITEKFQKQ